MPVSSRIHAHNLSLSIYIYTHIEREGERERERERKRDVKANVDTHYPQPARRLRQQASGALSVSDYAADWAIVEVRGIDGEDPGPSISISMVAIITIVIIKFAKCHTIHNRWNE